MEYFEWITVFASILRELGKREKRRKKVLPRSQLKTNYSHDNEKLMATVRNVFSLSLEKRWGNKLSYFLFFLFLLILHYKIRCSCTCKIQEKLIWFLSESFLFSSFVVFFFFLACFDEKLSKTQNAIFKRKEEQWVEESKTLQLERGKCKIYISFFSRYHVSSTPSQPTSD